MARIKMHILKEKLSFYPPCEVKCRLQNGVSTECPIGRAWKANINVWKRHLTLQSVFNRGECMMHVDKNSDDHVVDQNVDQISREIAYVPLGGGIRSKRSSYMQIFFSFFFLNEYKIYLPRERRILAHVFRGLKVLDPGSCFQKPRIFGSWLMFSED